MSLYYRDETITLHHGDAIKVASALDHAANKAAFLCPKEAT